MILEVYINVEISVDLFMINTEQAMASMLIVF